MENREITLADIFLDVLSKNLSDDDKEKEKNSYKHFAKSLGKILKENLRVAQQLI